MLIHNTLREVNDNFILVEDRHIHLWKMETSALSVHVTAKISDDTKLDWLSCSIEMARGAARQKYTSCWNLCREMDQDMLITSWTWSRRDYPSSTLDDILQMLKKACGERTGMVFSAMVLYNI